jgi:hypothetical protein
MRAAKVIGLGIFFSFVGFIVANARDFQEQFHILIPSQNRNMKQ